MEDNRKQAGTFLLQIYGGTSEGRMLGLLAFPITLLWMVTTDNLGQDNSLASQK